MGARQYRETTCKSALNRVSGMPFAWSLNPYRGCAHSCHYCYARATHVYLGLNADDDFERHIIVKVNIAEVLRRELAARSWRREQIAVGTATDPYQPCEGRFALMRDVLQALIDHRTPASIVTKSTLVLRDQELLVALQAVAGVRVNLTVTTLEPTLWRSIEPGTPPPTKRLEILGRLVAAGVPCGVFMAPILPGLTDTEASIDAVARAAREHGATSFWASPLRLAPLVKEHYLGWVAEFSPELLAPYARAYPQADPPRIYREQLAARIARVRQRYGFGDDERHERKRIPIADVQGDAAMPERFGGQLALPF
ncbi:MAG TPA: radical SAM protein [Thermomicrobiales bacterium]|nr:radical SAM protein [Thermomicrobiales bacterium]